MPWGAKAEYAYRAGYDGMGRVSVTHVVERGYSAMLKQPEMVSRVSASRYHESRHLRAAAPAHVRVNRPASRAAQPELGSSRNIPEGRRQWLAFARSSSPPDGGVAGSRMPSVGLCPGSGVVL